MLCHSVTAPIRCQHKDLGFGFTKTRTLMSVRFAIAWILLAWCNDRRRFYLLYLLVSQLGKDLGTFKLCDDAENNRLLL